MPTIRIFPREDASNGWSRILPARPPAAPLEGDVRADWLVVGAGFAGLAAARRLAENRPDDRIVLLEAHEVGEGASGRNSGFAIDLPHNVGGEFQELSNAQGYIRLSRAAIDYLDGCVARHGIDCAYTRRGKYHAAVSELGAGRSWSPSHARWRRSASPIAGSTPQSSGRRSAPPITRPRCIRRAGGCSTRRG